MKTLWILAMLVAPMSVQATETYDPQDNSRSHWEAECRVVLETLWGKDVEDFWGYGFGHDRLEALQEAQYEGRIQCDYRQNGNSLLKCTVDKGKCHAFPGPHHP